MCGGRAAAILGGVKVGPLSVTLGELALVAIAVVVVLDYAQHGRL